MKTCKTCNHWGEGHSENRVCLKIQSENGIEIEFHGNRDEGSYWEVKTNAEFGCRFHLSNDECPEPITFNNLHILNDVQIRAKAGDANAQYALGIAYINREDVIQHHANKESFVWLRKAANQGHWAAQHALGMSYFSGKGVEVNKDEAQRWFVLAETNRKGTMKFTDQEEEAIKTPAQEDPVKGLREAAEQGNVNAQHNLGVCYDNGYGGVEVNKEEAKRWLALAAANRIALAETKRKGTIK